jgi:hypothetical protein
MISQLMVATLAKFRMGGCSFTATFVAQRTQHRYYVFLPQNHSGGTGPRLGAYRVGGMPQGIGTKPNQP